MPDRSHGRPSRGLLMAPPRRHRPTRWASTTVQWWGADSMSLNAIPGSAEAGAFGDPPAS
ncbi:hypothetical protein PJP10_05325 [Mycobacterium kansasii]